MLLVAPLSNKHVGPEKVVSLRLLPPRRVTVTTSKGFLVLLDKLKLSVLNVG